MRNNSDNRPYELIQAIHNRTTFDHPIDQFELIVTHISYSLLTVPYTCKFKRPLNLGL